MRKNIIRGVTGGCGLVVLVSLCAFGMVSNKAGESNTIQKAQNTADVKNDGNVFETQFEKAWLSQWISNPSGEAHKMTAAEPAPAPEPVTQEAVEVPQEISEGAVETEVVQPTPEPNTQVIVAAGQPTEEEPTPTPETAEIPVVASVEEPGNVNVEFITVPVEPAPASETPADASAAYSTEAQMASIQGGCTIMGTTYTYLNQMVNYYCANETYPAFYQNTDAPTIQAFCQIYIEEAAAEGVRAEVAFCQAMKETGFLRYQGDVRIEQFNFAGIGATGGGVQGNYFASVRDGIRAQIQHLKAYASTDGLNGACVDPRFHYVRRGTTPYVEWLGIHENPYGGGWAAAVNYGGSIINDYIVKLFSY